MHAVHSPFQVGSKLNVEMSTILTPLNHKTESKTLRTCMHAALNDNYVNLLEKHSCSLHDLTVSTFLK